MLTGWMDQARKSLKNWLLYQIKMCDLKDEPLLMGVAKWTVDPVFASLRQDYLK